MSERAVRRQPQPAHFGSSAQVEAGTGATRNSESISIDDANRGPGRHCFSETFFILHSDQYRVTRDEQGNIANDPNRPDDEQYILRLIGQVITVSLETLKVVKGLPAVQAGE